MTVEIHAMGKDFRQLGQLVAKAPDRVVLRDCLGQRFIGAGMGAGKELEITGVPGNALGAYLDGGRVEVFGNAQDAVGDTMNDGEIVIHGRVGDTAGYAMRGGRLFVEGGAGYRAGVHMKEYQGKRPAMVIGGRAGSFLGEYQAGGTLVVLGLEGSGPIVGNFPCAGMHGGKVFLRSDGAGIAFPAQVSARPAARDDLGEIQDLIERFCALFGGDPAQVLDHPFILVTPDSKNPYRQMYVAN